MEAAPGLATARRWRTVPVFAFRAVAIAAACLLVGLASAGHTAIADGGAQFFSGNLTLALPGNGDPSFITIDLLMADDGSDDFDVHATAVGEQLLAQFPGAVPITSGEVSAQYLLKRYKWLDSHPSWGYNPAGKPATLSDDAEAIKAAAASWGAIGANVGFVDAGITAATPGACQNVADGLNTIGWRTLPAGVLATTCTYWSASAGATESDIQIDPSWSWTTNLSVIRMDLQSVVTHELGHALGMDHPCDFSRPTTCDPSARTTVMYGTYLAGTNRRTPQPDDIAGILAVYGPTESPAPSRLAPPAQQSALQAVLPYRRAIAAIARE